MNPKESRARAHIIHSLHETFLGNVFRKQQESKLKQMAELVIENQVIRGSNTACFMFEGNWYTHPWNLGMPRKAKEFDRTIDPSLLRRAWDIMHGETFEDTQNHSAIRNMIGKALSLCRSCRDFDILPEGVGMMTVNQANKMLEVFTGEPLSQEERDQFYTDTAVAREALAGIFMMDLLTSKVA